MKKISTRAVSLLLIACLVLFGLGVFIVDDYNNGRKWALFFPTYNSAAEGRIVDRNGKELAYFNGAVSTFSSSPSARVANYHVTGDYWGRTGAGLISSYWESSQNYDFIGGTTQATSSTLHLNIDSSVNEKAYELLSAAGKGCVMICNYRTGEVLCMVSAPSVDPLIDNATPEDGAYINRCLSAAFTPGSTFKLITSAAAIENIANLGEFSFCCEEEYDIAGVKIKCTTAHGTENFEQALANSCNCAFAKLTVNLGQDTMIKYVKDYGFLDSLEIDGIKTVPGTYPLDFVGDPELAWSGIGQSVDLVCPYAMLRYVSAIANGGSVFTMHLVNTGDVPTSTALVHPETARELKRLMRNNVVSHYEGEINFPGLELCAKTGTAEQGDGTDHSWFVGFLDDEEHPYAFVSLVENGGFGLWTAGLMMNELLQYMVN